MKKYDYIPDNKIETELAIEKEFSSPSEMETLSFAICQLTLTLNEILEFLKKDNKKEDK